MNDDSLSVIAEDKDFRIVRVSDGDRVTYYVELSDGCDRLGVEKWKEVSADGKVVKAMRDYIIRTALQQQPKG